jgi:flavodoxin
MKGLVAYYTKYGNGKIIAEAIARGLQESGNETTIINIPAKDIGGGYDFVVVSSPTRFGRMTKPVKKFIAKNLIGDAWRGKPFIAVGTGLWPDETGEGSEQEEPAHPANGKCGPAESADKVYEELENAGLKPATRPQKFFVSGMKGPLREGEEERALEFGRETGRDLAER